MDLSETIFSLLTVKNSLERAENLLTVLDK